MQQFYFQAFHLAGRSLYDCNFKLSSENIFDRKINLPQSVFNVSAMARSKASS